jgi:hypothetical protein
MLRGGGVMERPLKEKGASVPEVPRHPPPDRESEPSSGVDAPLRDDPEAIRDRNMHLLLMAFKRHLERRGAPETPRAAGASGPRG